MLTILIPAHNEGTRRAAAAVGRHAAGATYAPITDTLKSLRRQTVQPYRVVVIADNCTDDTARLAWDAGAEVFVTVDNVHKKAGGLNQWLDLHLSSRRDTDTIMVMDADSALNDDFLEHALGYIDRGYHAVGGIFLGKEGGGLVGMYQRNEYARYARDVARKGGRTLVLTGTATVFTARCLKDVVKGRSTGRIPDTGRVSHVYDTKALTEDNELTFALLHLGYEIIAPPECGLRTEVMETWEALRLQRFRWKRGAIENNNHYGLTRYTAKYQFLQWWSGLGILVTVLYLATIVAAVVTQSFHVVAFWMAVTVVYMLERVVTVRSRGPRQMLVAGVLLIEMPYDITLQYVQARAFLAALLRTKKNW
ncbi:glycosyltransferase family 2 protein [Luteipulveratus sp. YIM 133132]|uniref:glycosyltransferase n=1 Tax=Luteipulveratus flavus TaxID=3031728 RepID=UPI0023AF130C|nr:glycosyltransferase family 2 protein [Luteipulveratus sp. YIM 133132]MDE9364405.1 glycosyltransferase family 2 protein [Luteipulveratus sp. YIM 133132]